MNNNCTKDRFFLKISYVLSDNTDAFSIYPYDELDDACEFIKFLANLDECKSISVEMLEKFEKRQTIYAKGVKNG